MHRADAMYIKSAHMQSKGHVQRHSPCTRRMPYTYTSYSAGTMYIRIVHVRSQLPCSPKLPLRRAGDLSHAQQKRPCTKLGSCIRVCSCTEPVPLYRASATHGGSAQVQSVCPRSAAQRGLGVERAGSETVVLIPHRTTCLTLAALPSHFRLYLTLPLPSHCFYLYTSVSVITLPQPSHTTFTHSYNYCFSLGINSSTDSYRRHKHTGSPSTYFRQSSH